MPCEARVSRVDCPQGAIGGEPFTLLGRFSSILFLKTRSLNCDSSRRYFSYVSAGYWFLNVMFRVNFVIMTYSSVTLRHDCSAIADQTQNWPVVLTLLACESKYVLTKFTYLNFHLWLHISLHMDFIIVLLQSWTMYLSTLCIQYNSLRKCFRQGGHFVEVGSSPRSKQTGLSVLFWIKGSSKRHFSLFLCHLR